jgi:hypothetical protein
MNKNCVFTIVAKNYLGLAHVLEKSLKKHNRDTDFIIFIADEFDKDIDIENLPSNVFIAKTALQIKEEEWIEMSFKYNVTEFCTAIKPTCFKYLFHQDTYTNIVYVDPDILFFSSLSPVYNLLKTHSIVLTPHLTELQVNYEGDYEERTFFASGIYNLGFCALSKSEAAFNMLTWWEERLKDKCFLDNTRNYFTDQKWMDFLPGYFSSKVLHISHNLGLNAAPWNFSQREFVKKGSNYYVKPRNENKTNELDMLVFVHFSGYNYSELKQGNLKRKNSSISSDKYLDTKDIFNSYMDALITSSDSFNKYINMPYSYSTYDNGMIIDKFHRRLYNGLIEDGHILQSPFSNSSKSFFSALKKHKLLNKSEVAGSTTRYNVPNISKKKKYINYLFKALFYLIGYKRYVLFVRSLVMYNRMETHTFLFGKRFKNTYRDF